MNLTTRIGRIRSNVSMADYLNSKGTRVEAVGRASQVHCCFESHPDLNPSARVFHDSNIYVCFVCGYRGDVLDLECTLSNCGLGEAVAKLEEEWNLATLDVPEVPRNYVSTDMQQAQIFSRVRQIKNVWPEDIDTQILQEQIREVYEEVLIKETTEETWRKYAWNLIKRFEKWRCDARLFGLGFAVGVTPTLRGRSLSVSRERIGSGCPSIAVTGNYFQNT